MDYQTIECESFGLIIEPESGNRVFLGMIDFERDETIYSGPYLTIHQTESLIYHLENCSNAFLENLNCSIVIKDVEHHDNEWNIISDNENPCFFEAKCYLEKEKNLSCIEFTVFQLEENEKRVVYQLKCCSSNGLFIILQRQLYWALGQLDHEEVDQESILFLERNNQKAKLKEKY